MTAWPNHTLKALIKSSLATGGKKGPHITRFSMYRALQDAFREFDGPTTKTLALSHSVPLAKKILGLRRTRYTTANYPKINILKLPFPDNEFDFCISDQVPEHVEGDPFVAFQETARVVKAHGYLCHTTCFINPVHGAPKDFWRFTPNALRLMATAAGCKTLHAAGWGNKQAWAVIDAGFRYAGIPADKNHPLHKIATWNDPKWPICVWIVAQKRPAGLRPV